jgi:hypothetical protein
MPTDFLSSGLRLGGVWADSYRQITYLQEKEQRLTELTSMMAEDIASLLWEKTTLTEVYRVNAASLSTTEVSHLKAMQIIDHVRQERSKLESRCTSLESQREWLDTDRLQLKALHIETQEKLEVVKAKVEQLEEIERGHIQENSTLQELVYARDSTIENLRGKLTVMTHQHEVLTKSLSTKDRQFQILLKDRNRLKDENESLKKQLIRRPPTTTTSHSSIVNNGSKTGSNSISCSSYHVPPAPLSSASFVDTVHAQCMHSPPHTSSSSSSSSPSCVASFSISPATSKIEKEKFDASVDEQQQQNLELDAEVTQVLSQPLSGLMEEAKERQLLRIIKSLSKRPAKQTVQYADSEIPSNPWTPTQRRAHLVSKTRSLLSPSSRTPSRKEMFTSPPATPSK